MADCTRCPRSLNKERTRPHSLPHTKISPTSNVPFCTKTVATEPRPLSMRASTTTPSAVLSGSAFSSKISACSKMVSINLSKLIFCLADTSTSITSPPIASTTTPCCNKSVRTFCGLAPGTSILLMATTIGTFAA